MIVVAMLPVNCRMLVREKHKPRSVANKMMPMMEGISVQKSESVSLPLSQPNLSLTSLVLFSHTLPGTLFLALSYTLQYTHPYTYTYTHTHTHTLKGDYHDLGTCATAATAEACTHQGGAVHHIMVHVNKMGGSSILKQTSKQTTVTCDTVLNNYILQITRASGLGAAGPAGC